MGNVEIGDRVRIEAGSSLPEDFKVPRDAIGTVKQKHSDPKSKGVWIDVDLGPGVGCLFAVDAAEFELVVEPE